MSVQITPEIESLVRSIQAGGQYETETEVLGEALRLLKQRDELRRNMMAGIEQLNRGSRLPADEVFDRLERRAADLDSSAR